MNLILDSFLCRLFFFYLLPGLNTPTSSLWRRSLKANRTSTLSCNCEYFFRLSPSLLVPSPTRRMSHAINCAPRYTHMCRTAHKRVHSLANRETHMQPPCLLVSTSGGVGPHTCILSASRPNPTSTEMSSRKGPIGIGSTINREAAENINH